MRVRAEGGRRTPGRREREGRRLEGRPPLLLPARRTHKQRWPAHRGPRTRTHRFEPDSWSPPCPSRGVRVSAQAKPRAPKLTPTPAPGQHSPGEARSCSARPLHHPGRAAGLAEHADAGVPGDGPVPGAAVFSVRKREAAAAPARPRFLRALRASCCAGSPLEGGRPAPHAYPLRGRSAMSPTQAPRRTR